MVAGIRFWGYIVLLHTSTLRFFSTVFASVDNLQIWELAKLNTRPRYVQTVHGFSIYGGQGRGNNLINRSQCPFALGWSQLVETASLWRERWQLCVNFGVAIYWTSRPSFKFLQMLHSSTNIFDGRFLTTLGSRLIFYLNEKLKILTRGRYWMSLRWVNVPCCRNISSGARSAS